jgi:hypothetical protein
LVRRWKSHAVEAERGVGRSPKHKFVSWLRRSQIYAQDKLLGIGEMARAISDHRTQLMSPDFLTHLNELTWLIQRAGASGVAMVPETTFKPLVPPADVLKGQPDYRAMHKPRYFERKLSGFIDHLQKR